MEKNAKLGMPKHVFGLSDREDIDPLSAALGMANFVKSNSKNEPIQLQTKTPPFGRFGRIGNWLIENI